MKLVLKDGKKEVEVSEITGIDEDSEVLIFFLKKHVQPHVIGNLVDSLERKLDKKVIILPDIFLDKIYGL
jgi:hypothetical protein